MIASNLTVRCNINMALLKPHLNFTIQQVINVSTIIL